MSGVATTIFHQLGGRRFVAMTGAKNVMASGQGLVMHVTGQNRDGKRVRSVKISLEPSDTYLVEAHDWQGTGPIVERFSMGGVYCDMLADVFEEATGLLTKL